MRNTLGMKMFKGMKGQSNKVKTIEFICEDPSLDYFPKPVPASKRIPEWYKKLTTHIDNQKIYADGNSNLTVKKCMPVFDSMTAGYYILLPCDVWVTRNPDNTASFTWPIHTKMVTDHPQQQASTFTPPPGYGPEFLKWTNVWIIKVPDGWSVLFTQPMHRDDLPFQILPGIVDADHFKLSVQFPFLLKKDFTGLIPAGTPIAQVIPFKREEWEAQYSSLEPGQKEKNLQEHSVIFENRYKKTFWNKKVFK
jgi:hypothetical protein